jgi:hypothetical protein
MRTSERVRYSHFPVESAALTPVTGPADVARRATATDATPRIVFVICVLAVAARLIFINQPYVDHWSWRQSDVATIARNFLQNGFRFGYPQIDWAGNAPGYGVCHAERMQTIVVGRFTRSLRLSRSSDRAVYAGRAASLLFLEQAFNPRNTQMNANRKELVLDFAKLSGCDTSSYRFGSNAALDEKRCEDAPHSRSTSCESLFRFVSIRVVRGQQNFSKAV